MPQVYSNNKSKIINCSELKYGELGEIVDCDGHNGDIITKIYKDFLLVYSVNSHEAFKACWDNPAFMVRVLEPDESITLSN